MIEDKVNPGLVGGFVLLLGGALIAALLWLASGGLWSDPRDRYLSYMEESVSGLSLNAPVKFRGVEVGQVRSIRLDPKNPDRVQLAFDIERGTPITVDTVAVLKTQGLTGISYVELSGGVSGSAPLLPTAPGLLPVIPSKASLSARLEDVLTTVLAKVERTANTLEAVLSEGNRVALSNALADIAIVTRTLASRSGTLDGAIVNGARALEQASLAAGELRPVITQVGRSAQALEVMGRDTALASARAASAVADAGQSVQSLGADTAPELQRLLGALQGRSLSLQRFSDAAERSPTTLLFGRAALAPGPGEPGTRPLPVEPASTTRPP